jgi:hypothetical protein
MNTDSQNESMFSGLSPEAVALVEQAAQVEVEVALGTQARIWRGVEKRRARAAWRLAFPMFVAGAATAALLVVLAQPKSATPSEMVARPTMPPTIPLSGEPELVELGAAGKLVAGANTAARIDHKAGAIDVVLDHGSLLLHVNPRSPGESFVIRTRELTARVVGTVLRVAVDAGGHASVAVGHGAVAVTPLNGAPVMVKTGERWPADSNEEPSAAELDKLGAADLEGARFAPSESALYQSGWQKMKRGEMRGALAVWQDERARFPHGALAREAHASIIDALVALKDDRRARREVDAYLAEAPHDLRAPEMHFVRGTLLYAADHDCRRAAPELDLALRHPAQPWETRARLARAACRHR